MKKLLSIIKSSAAFSSVRNRLILLTVIGLALTMSIWGWIQLTALDKILIEQQIQRLMGVAETVSTLYQFFPETEGLASLDAALKDHLQTDIRLARIDIFDTSKKGINYVSGASRIQYDWPESIISAAHKKGTFRYTKLTTEAGPALGLLYPAAGEKESSRFVVGIIGFTKANVDFINHARKLLFISSIGLIFVILSLFLVSYRWIIGTPLQGITHTMDEFRRGRYINRIPIKRADEFGTLAEHFNIMADEIHNVMIKNLELTKHLENRVREETGKVVHLQKQLDDLKQLTALGHLTANLAHDLGTPIHSIGGLAKLLLEEKDLSADVARKLELIVQQTQRLDDIIQNVRKETRLPEPHFELLSIQQLFSETLPLVEPLLQNKTVSLHAQITDNVYIYADRYRIQTALLNIFQNSLEAMEQGGDIVISGKLSEHDGFVSISVTDSGGGMSPDFVQKAFEPFFSTKRDGSLRGLGLAIVSDIVKIHNGKIEIKSSPGRGTSVILHLPIAKKESHSKK
jgi:signal transduction histidine kinase